MPPTILQLFSVDMLMRRAFAGRYGSRRRALIDSPASALGGLLGFLRTYVVPFGKPTNYLLSFEKLIGKGNSVASTYLPIALLTAHARGQGLFACKFDGFEERISSGEPTKLFFPACRNCGIFISRKNPVSTFPLYFEIKM